MTMDSIYTESNPYHHTYLDVMDSIANSALIGTPMLSFVNESCNIYVSYYFDNHHLHFEYAGENKELEREYADYWYNVCYPKILEALKDYTYNPDFTGCGCSRLDDNNMVDLDYMKAAYDVIMENLSSYDLDESAVEIFQSSTLEFNF